MLENLNLESYENPPQKAFQMNDLLFFRSARTWAMLAPILALVFALGCEQAWAQQRSRPQTLDDLFAAVARRVPEFGGMFLAQNERKLHIYLTSVATKEVNAVRRAIVVVFGAAIIPRGGIEALQGQYGFLQLREWYTRMEGPILGTPGVTFTDIDEAKNRLGIGVERSEGEARVVELLGRLDIPREAVVIQVTGPVEPLGHSLQMPNSMSPWPYPREGGYIITRLLCNQTGIGLKQGTLGFNVRKAGNVVGFITNSHNTAAWWKLDAAAGFPPANIYQANGYYPPHLVGREYIDSQGFTGSPCPATKICRYSDSALIRYNNNVAYALGRLGRTTGITTSISSPIITIDHGGSPPGEFLIVARPQTPYLVGLTLNKVGQKTGWTQGTIQMTNATFPQQPFVIIGAVCPGGLQDTTLPPPPPGATLLSQYVVGHPTNDVVDGGDSGSSVFRIIDSQKSRVALYGILWGRYSTSFKSFIFSPIGGVPFQQTGIQTDLGPFSYCAPGFGPC